MLEKIYLYHTNDLHSYFDNWAQVAKIVKDKRKERTEKNEAHYLIDIGDHLDRVHPITEATMGKANVSLLNELDYDVVTIGNNEGITLSHHQLYHLYDDATFAVVCSNMTSKHGNVPEWLKLHHTLETVSGIKIGFLGLTAAFNPYYHQLDWHMEHPFDTIQTYLEQLKQSVDVVVLLSHIGIYDDQRLAEMYPEIDLIIGGHTHHLLRDGEIIGETLLAACGKQCSHVGEIELVWDHTKGILSSKEATTFPVEDFPKDRETAATIDQLEEDASFILNKEIAILDEKLSVQWFRKTKVMKEFTKELQTWIGADCAFLNAGLLLDELPAGTVSYGDIHRICPHPINPCVVEISGAALLETMQLSASKELMELKLKGFGFRGEIIGKMIYSNVEMTWTEDRLGNRTLEHVLIGKQAIVKDKIYKVATGDLFTFGSLLPAIANAENCTLYMPELLRDILMQTVIRLGQS